MKTILIALCLIYLTGCETVGVINIKGDASFNVLCSKIEDSKISELEQRIKVIEDKIKNKSKNK